MGSLENVSASLARLSAANPSAPVIDAIADPVTATIGLSENHVMLRAEPEVGPAASGYGPRPVVPVWLSLSRGSNEVTVVSLLGGPEAVRRVDKVTIDQTPTRCCDAASCTLERVRMSVWIELAPSSDTAPPARYLVAEQLSADPAPGDAVRPVAVAIASLLGVSVATDETETMRLSGTIESTLPHPIDGPSREELARFALRSEGDRVVLRDWASRGPREGARKNLVVGILFGAVGVACLARAAMRLQGPAGDTPFGLLVVGALLALTGYAFFGISRFAARYVAQSLPLLAIGRDLLIVHPWVGRDGAVDLRPEGRFGAAIPLGEVRASRVAPRGNLFAVELDTDHGPIDAFTVERDATARYWGAAIDRIADECRHPRTMASARQRARAKK